MQTERPPGFLTGVALLVPITLAVMAVVILAPILPKLLAEFKDTPNADYWVPMMLTVTALCVTVFSGVAGWMGDRFGRRPILIGAMVVYGIVGVAPAFLSDFWVIFGTRVVVGICEAFIMVLSTTMIGDFFSGSSRDKWLASQTAVASLSALFLFNVGGLLGEYGWRAPFFVYASSLIMLFLILAFTWEPKHPTPAPGVAEAGKVKFPWAITIGICIVTVFASVMFYIFQIEASIGLTQHGVTDPSRIGLLLSIASLSVPTGTIVFRFLSRLSPALLLTIEFAILSGGFVGMGMAPDATGFIIAATVNQLGAGMILPTLLTWAIRQFPYAVRGRGTGIWQGAFSIGQFLAAIVVTFVSSHVGGLFPAFVALGYVCAAAAVIALVMLILRRRPQTIVEQRIA